MTEHQIWLRLMFAQAALAVKTLREAGVSGLLLKGGAGLLAGWFQAERRPLIDIDLLILPDDLRKAVGVLEANGWSGTFQPYIPCDARRHSRPVSSPVGGILLDIHWFSLRHARWRGVDDVLWQGAGRAQLGDEEILLPSPEDFLVHTIAHGRRAGSPGSVWKQDVRNLLEHPELRLDWDRVAWTVQNYRVAPMVAAGLEEIREVAPHCLPDGICERLNALPTSRSDRVFLHLTHHFSEEIGFAHAAVVALDFTRTRPCPARELPAQFLRYLKDRWELESPWRVPGRFAEVLLWGLQLEVRRFWKHAREALDKGGSGRPSRRAKRRPRHAPTVRGAKARILIGICSCRKNGERRVL